MQGSCPSLERVLQNRFVILNEVKNPGSFAEVLSGIAREVRLSAFSLGPSLRSAKPMQLNREWTRINANHPACAPGHLSSIK